MIEKHVWRKILIPQTGVIFLPLAPRVRAELGRSQVSDNIRHASRFIRFIDLPYL